MSNKRGFTLSELIIAMSLLAVVAAAVLLLITSMSKFSKGSSQTLRRMSELEDVQIEFNRWLSTVDVEGAKIEINLGNTLLKASGEGWEYTVRRVDANDEDGGILQFNYPAGETEGKLFGEAKVVLSIPEIKSIYFKQQGEDSSSFPAPYSEGDEQTFPLSLHVNSGEFLGKVVFF